MTRPAGSGKKKHVVLKSWLKAVLIGGFLWTVLLTWQFYSISRNREKQELLGRKMAARSVTSLIEEASRFLARNGRLPKDFQEMVTAPGHSSYFVDPYDHWGHRVVLDTSGSQPRAVSLGADGVLGTQDDIASDFAGEDLWPGHDGIMGTDDDFPNYRFTAIMAGPDCEFDTADDIPIEIED